MNVNPQAFHRESYQEDTSRYEKNSTEISWSFQTTKGVTGQLIKTQNNSLLERVGSVFSSIREDISDLVDLLICSLYHNIMATSYIVGASDETMENLGETRDWTRLNSVSKITGLKIQMDLEMKEKEL